MLLSVLSVLACLALAQGAAGAWLAARKNRQLFCPASGPGPEAADWPDDVHVQLVRFEREPGRMLPAFDVAPPRLGASVPVVLLLHGNASTIATRAPLVARLARVGRFRVFTPEYSGYGGCEGEPSEAGIAADALAAFDHLVDRGIDPRRIVLYGTSIGAGPALHVAMRRRVGGIVLHATFSSLSSMALRRYPWAPLGALLVRGDFRNADRLARARCPALIVHGTCDEVIPIAEAERLFAARPDAAFLRVEGAGHDDVFEIAGDAYMSALGELFRLWVPRAAAAA